MKILDSRLLAIVLVVLCASSSTKSKPIFAGGFGFAPIVYDKPQNGSVAYRTGPVVDLYAGKILSSAIDIGLRINVTGYELDSPNPGTRGFIGPTMRWYFRKSGNSAFLVGGAGSFFVHQSGNSHHRFGGGALAALGAHLSPKLTICIGGTDGKVEGASLGYVFAIIEWLKF
jgi:hypothetical protein